MDTRAFWVDLEAVVASHAVVIDRPKGSPHPVYSDIVYPVDYGYLQGTKAMDGGGIDVFVGTAGKIYVAGVLLTADTVKSDLELKILLSCTAGETGQIINMLSSEYMSVFPVLRSHAD